MKTIDTNDLSTVTGGKAPQTQATTGDSGGNDQLLSTLQGIQSSLKDLNSKNQNQGLFGGQNGLLFMTMALAFSQRRTDTVVVNGGGRCGRGGFSWRVW